MDIKDQVTQLVKQCESNQFEELAGQENEVLSKVFQTLTRKWGRPQMKRRIPKVTYLKMVVANSNTISNGRMNQRIEKAIAIA